MLNLLWKEWHEQRWKLAYGCLMLCAFALIGMRCRVVADETLLTWVCFLGITLLPILASMGLIPAERSEGSFNSLLALPAPRWQIFASKTVMGLLLCAGPLLAATLVSIIVAGGREITSGQMMLECARSIAACLSLFMWMFVLTIGLPSEARAGLVSLGILFIALLLMAGLLYAVALHSKMLSRLWWASPFEFTFSIPANDRDSEYAQISALGALAVQPLIAAGLWFWGLRRLSAEGQA
ncbi:MAG TPA: ABC transporter permease subunit [Humisphaera sp.]|jgi:ABC-type transport system involved in multi-copper enzyme maturation permease subunit|nr:ABC transporter permease subunit [Humisphaera sp.]